MPTTKMAEVQAEVHMLWPSSRSFFLGGRALDGGIHPWRKGGTVFRLLLVNKLACTCQVGVRAAGRRG